MIFRMIRWGIAIALIAIQFIPVDRDVPEYDKQKDFMTVMQVPEEMATVIKTACYDCHSYETSYPWYAQIAPVSWWIQKHVKQGRRHLNFSAWGNYPGRKAHHKLEECFEEVEKGEMPMSSYTLMHGSASLDAAKTKQVIEFFTQLYKSADPAAEK